MSRLKGSGYRVKEKNTFLVVDDPCFPSSVVFRRSRSEPPPTASERTLYLGDSDALDEQQSVGTATTENVSSASASLDTLPPWRAHCGSTASTYDVLPSLSDGQHREWLQEKRGIGGAPCCSATAIAMSVATTTTSDPAPTPHSKSFRAEAPRASRTSEGSGMFGGSPIGSVKWIFGAPDQSKHAI